jgi:hypothetical protein
MAARCFSTEARMSSAADWLCEDFSGAFAAGLSMALSAVLSTGWSAGLSAALPSTWGAAGGTGGTVWARATEAARTKIHRIDALIDTLIG